MCSSLQVCIPNDDFKQQLVVQNCVLRCILYYVRPNGTLSQGALEFPRIVFFSESTLHVLVHAPRSERHGTPPKLQVPFQVMIYFPGHVNISLLSGEVIISKASQVNISHFSGGLNVSFSSQVNIYISAQVKRTTKYNNRSLTKFGGRRGLALYLAQALAISLCFRAQLAAI